VDQVPPGVLVTQATLRLITSNYDDGRDFALDVGAYKLNRNWQASEVSYNVASTGVPWALPGADSAPSDRDASPVDVQTLREVSTGTKPHERVAYTWDVTSIVQSWVDSLASREAGLMLMSPSGPYRNIGFWSSSYQGDLGRELHPLLTVHWREREPTPTPTITQTPLPSTGIVQGTVYDDANMNGVRDSGEAGVLGVTVRLLAGTTVVGQASTPGSGEYRFANVPAGAYELRALLPSGWAASSANPRPIGVIAGGTTLESVGIYRLPVLPLHLPLINREA
jgi:hypothetical protein